MSSPRKFKFKEKIYKVGINWCVDVPDEVSRQMTKENGKINIKGKINGYEFIKTLMPVKNAPHRLFINQVMMKGGNTALGKIATFEIVQNNEKIVPKYPLPKLFQIELNRQNLTKQFNKLTEARKQNILKYLTNIKTEETLSKNIGKLIVQLKSKEKNVRIP